VRQTGVLDRVAVILEAQSKPYRQMRELGEDLPRAGPDHHGRQRLRRPGGAGALAPRQKKETAAIERVQLGLGV
jgi:hypothetical protein